MRKIAPPKVKAKAKVSAPGASRFATTSEDEDLIKTVTGRRLTRNILRELGVFTNKVLSNPDKIDLKTYKNMHETDETIQSGIEFISLSALGMLGAYTNENPKIEEAVVEAITGLEENWIQFLDELITDGCVYGFGNAEVCMEVVGNSIDNLKTKLKAIVPVSPLSGKFKFDLGKYSPTHGDIEGFMQWPDTGYEKLLPANKLVTWSHKSRHGNAYGTSRLKCIWKNWVIKDQMLKSWALAMDRSGSPVTWIQCADGDALITDPISGEPIKRADYLLDLLDDIENVNGFIVGPEEQVGQIQVPRSVGADFKIIEDHMNGMMFRGMLIPILLIDTSDVGSNALAQQHFKVYIMSMSKLMQMILPIIIRRVIKPFIIANFGPQKNYGRFGVKQLAEESLKILADIFYGLTQNGYMTPKMKSDMDNVRNSLNIQPMSQDEFDEYLEIKKKEEEAAKPAPGIGDPNKPAPVGGRKGNPKSPQPEKPGTRPAPSTPTKKEGRPAKK